MVTPFRRDEGQTINYEAGEQLVERIIAGGASGIFTFGSNGEFHVCTPDEKIEFSKFVIERVAGRVPVYVGTGSCSTREAVEMSKRAEDAGASAVSVINPYFMKVSDAEVEGYYEAVAESVKIPVLTFIIIALFCLFIVWFRKTKLGQDMRAVGQDMEVARDAGIKVERTRIISIVMSTVFSGFGMIIYLQNMGNIATYSSHSQIGMFCIAALLVGGASVDKASIGNVFLGVILFHTMFIVAPSAGAKITGDSMIGEYFRVFVSYAVITVALIMYETKKRKSQSLMGQILVQAQKEEEGKAE